MKERNILIELSYNGSAYNGWQKQKKHKTVQGELEIVLSKIFNEKIVLTGCGRTDAKAHALCYTANFKTKNQNIPSSSLKKILNNRIAEDIRILNVKEMPLDFNARFSAQARKYIYIILNQKEVLPHSKDFFYQIEREIDLKKLKKILKIFEGKHNFKYFCSGYGDENKNFERIIYYFNVRKLKILNQNFIIFFIKGNGFLQGMIRTLISVALNYEEGKLTEEDIVKALSLEKDIPAKFKVKVPACGLYFKKAYY